MANFTSGRVGRNDDFLRYNLDQAQPISVDFGEGVDTVQFTGDGFSQVRISFTSAEVGNDNPNDAGTLANQDGGLAVRVQAETADGTPSGPVSRFDDEGISFISDGAFTFDVRDLVSGAARGDQFRVVRLGTSENDLFSERDSTLNTYINAGRGDDRVTGGLGNDFLVGGAGNDTLNGGQGDDTFLGGAGNDIISDTSAGTDDLAIFNVSTDGSDQINLGRGQDTVNVAAAAGTTQVRLTFTSAEVGNNNANDAGGLANQDGGLAVRLQAEDGAGALTGMTSRVDDEGITFVATTSGLTFDVRDLVSGVARGDQFQVVQLGTFSGETIDRSAETRSTYINAGNGKDIVLGGAANDFLVGGTGDDRLNGNGGIDSHIGGAGADRFVFTDTPGDDRVLDFVSGTDKLDLSAFGIDFDDITITASGGGTLVAVDADGNGGTDFTITLVNNATPVQSDFLL